MNESDLFGESKKIKRNKAKLIPEQITLLSVFFFGKSNRFCTTSVVQFPDEWILSVISF